MVEKLERVGGLIVIRNKIIPFPSYKAINLFGIPSYKENARIDERTIRHEAIHTAQMKEMLYIFFYLWYVVEWLIRLCMKGNAYRNISFEKEAYDNERNLNYLESRKKCAWIKHIK